MLLRPILLVAAACYRVAYKLHHSLCLRPGKLLAHAQLIVVGSYLAGGAGKTPFTAWLAQFISAQFIQKNSAGSTGKGNAGKECAGEKPAAPRIAILCHCKAQDEASMLRQQLAGSSHIQVYATGNRYRTAHELDKNFDYVICDDGFEDTRLVNAKVIRLDWGEPPTHIADLLPAGKCRSLLQDHDAPALVLRCGTVLADNGTVPTSENHNTFQTNEPADISFTIACIKNAAGTAFTPQEQQNVVAACGIGNPERFRENLAAFGISPAEFVARPDHDKHFEQIINRLTTRGKTVIITAKDANRLPCSLINNPRIFTAYQQVNISEDTVSRLRDALFG